MERQDKATIASERPYFEADAGYPLSDNQVEFCLDAQQAAQEIDYTYSGRGMMGAKCPAVRCESPTDVPTGANVRVDNMGLRFVVYASR